MGGTPAPAGMAFPSASEPNPIAKGLRGTGPMAIINPTSPASPQGGTPGGPTGPAGQAPPSGPTGPQGTPYFFGAAGSVISPYNASIGQQYGANSMYFPSGTNIPQGYQSLGYYDPSNSMYYGNQPPSQTLGQLYQFVGGPNTAPESNAFSQLNMGNLNPAFAGYAGPAYAPFLNGNVAQGSPLSAFYSGQAYQQPGYYFK